MFLNSHLNPQKLWEELYKYKICKRIKWKVEGIRENRTSGRGNSRTDPRRKEDTEQPNKTQWLPWSCFRGSFHAGLWCDGTWGNTVLCDADTRLLGPGELTAACLCIFKSEICTCPPLRFGWSLGPGGSPWGCGHSPQDGTPWPPLPPGFHTRWSPVLPPPPARHIPGGGLCDQQNIRGVFLLLLFLRLGYRRHQTSLGVSVSFFVSVFLSDHLLWGKLAGSMRSSLERPM